jgi:hypothetical protein
MVPRTIVDELQQPDGKGKAIDWIRKDIKERPWRDTIQRDTLADDDKPIRMKLGDNSQRNIIARLTWSSRGHEQVHNPDTIPDFVKKVVPTMYLNQRTMKVLAEDHYPLLDKTLVEKVMAKDNEPEKDLSHIDILADAVIEMTIIHEVSRALFSFISRARLYLSLLLTRFLAYLSSLIRHGPAGPWTTLKKGAVSGKIVPL